MTSLMAAAGLLEWEVLSEKMVLLVEVEGTSWNVATS
jgi:hypothetical protein